MYLIAIAWIYVVLMMSIAEATNANGTVLGAIFTFILYGVLPCGILMYLLGTPSRRAKRRDQERLEAEPLQQPNAGSEAPADAVSPVREK